MIGILLTNYWIKLKTILSFNKKTILVQNKMDISKDDKKIRTLIKDQFPLLPPTLPIITHKKESIDKLLHLYMIQELQYVKGFL